VSVERIGDARDPRLAAYRDLRDPARAREGLFIAESRTVVRRLLVSRFRVRSLLLTEAALAGLGSAVAALDAGTPLYLASRETLRGVAGYDVHRGCLAAAERLEETAADALLGRPGPRALVVLEEVADPDNVGAVFRNAAALGADAVLLSPGCADPLSRKALRVSVGASLAVPFARVADWPGGLFALRRAGYALVALVPGAPRDIATAGSAWPIPPRLALLLGAEGAGLGEAARQAADLEVTIRMVPGVDSLNVATASGIALHRLRGAVPG
jgi:tRNA G18 (ribose-2'-O)-methylase SpoU